MLNSGEDIKALFEDWRNKQAKLFEIIDKQHWLYEAEKGISYMDAAEADALEIAFREEEEALDRVKAALKKRKGETV
jgi:GGDEF domain-containing protein